MKRYLPLFLLILAVAGISAQITVSNITFPAAGDTLKVAYDYSPTVIVAATAPGGSQTWDFSSLKVDATQNIIFSPASEGSVGAQVPDAGLFAVLSPATESYYNATPTSFQLLAYFGIVPYDLVANNLFEYNPPITERHAPLNFFDINQISSGFLENFLPSAFSPALMLNLALLTGNANIDSMRYRLAVNRLDVVDAWGSVIIPDGTYDVLREKRTLYRETRIDAKIPPLGWLDITDLAWQAGFNGLGVDTIVSFHFYNDHAKEPIAIVTVNNSFYAATQVMYKHSAVISAIEQAETVKPSVIVSPNPACDEAVIRFINLKPGHYRLIIFDVQGRMIEEKSGLVGGHNAEQIDLSRLLPGMYVITLFDENGQQIYSEKLLKGGS